MSDKEIRNTDTVNGGEVKSHMTNRPEDSNKEGTGREVSKPEGGEKKADAQSTSAQSTSAQTGSAAGTPRQAPPKKKKIIAVYNTQNSKTGFKGSKNDRRSPQGQKRQSDTGRTANHGGQDRDRTGSVRRPVRKPGSLVGPDGQRLSRPSDRSARLNGTAPGQRDETPAMNNAGAAGMPAANDSVVKTDAAAAAASGADARDKALTTSTQPENTAKEAGTQKTVESEKPSAPAGGNAAASNKPDVEAPVSDMAKARVTTSDGTAVQSRDGGNGTVQGQRTTQGRDGGNGTVQGQRTTQGRDGGNGTVQGQRTTQGRDGRNQTQGQGGRGGSRHSMQGASGGMAQGSSENRKSDGRRSDGRNRNDDSRKDRNSKFNDNWGGKPGAGKGNQGGQRNSQKNNRRGQTASSAPKSTPKKEDNTPKVIEIPEMISIQDLAERMKIQPSVIIKKLFLAGQLVTMNSELDFESAGEIAMEMNFDPVPEEKEDVIAKMLEDVEDPEESLVERPPVVCVMGHVDHGKTSLLDAIRDTHVIDREAGGITQHIGAYVVTIQDRNITFLDTPGHEAFTAMRMRGANSTDIAILVVAADDGVMPQTIEAINHAKAAGIEIIVAINKIDKPGANVERVKQELVEYELVPEDWGGSTVFVPVSAKTHEGIDTLLEMILLTADVLELKANPDRRARGLVIEAQLDKGRGPVATVLVQKGTLHIGDHIAVGASYGKVRAMMDENGHRVKTAGPSRPVEILGLNDVPAAGEIFVSPETEKEARAIAETYVKESREKLIEDTKLRMSLDDLYSQIQSGNLKELNIIIKADVQGSVEAVKQSLLKLSNEEVAVKIIHGGVGAINESDITLASASNAIVIGFNVKPDTTAKETAEREKVDVRLYRVIYDAINDVEAAMKGMLEPIYEEKVIGHAEVRQIFKASGVGNIAGSYVLDGTVQRGCKVRISREGSQIYEGSLASLKRFKDDVKEVRAGYECGLVFEKFNDIQELDIIEAYIMVEVPR